jgi:hypothetical protein
MEKEEISSSGQGIDKPDIKPVEGSQNNGAQNKSRVKSDTKPRKRKANSRKKLELAAWSTIAQIGVAIIGLIGTITVAWFSYKSSHPEPAPTQTLAPAALLSPTSLFTAIPVVLTNTPSPAVLPSLTFTLNATFSPTETATTEPSSAPKLMALLVANKTSGKAPLKVKFDARESYLTEYGGQTFVCRNGACYYTWKVYSGGQQLGKSATDSGGTFDYTFGKQGTYMVTVWICRGRDGVDCGGSGAQIIVTK